MSFRDFCSLRQVPTPESPSLRLRRNIETRFGSFAAWETSTRISCRDCGAANSFRMYQGCNARCGAESHKVKILDYYARSARTFLRRHLEKFHVTMSDSGFRVRLLPAGGCGLRVAGRVLYEVGDTEDLDASSYVRILSVSLAYHVAKAQHDSSLAWQYSDSDHD